MAELLAAADVEPPDDSSALAAKWSVVLANPTPLREILERVGTALQDHEELLHDESGSFHQYLQRTGEAWHARRCPTVAAWPS
jgi:hypothetical protein